MEELDRLSLCQPVLLYFKDSLKKTVQQEAREIALFAPRTHAKLAAVGTPKSPVLPKQAGGQTEKSPEAYESGNLAQIKRDPILKQGGLAPEIVLTSTHVLWYTLASAHTPGECALTHKCDYRTTTTEGYT